MSIIKLLAQDSFITYNKQIAKVVGVNEAIVFGNLCSISNRFEDEEFFYQQEKIIEDTSLSERAVRIAIKNLEDVGLIKVVKKGMPARYWYRINVESVVEIFNIVSTSGVKSDTTSGVKSETTCGVKSDTTINNKVNNNKINNNKIIDNTKVLSIKKEKIIKKEKKYLEKDKEYTLDEAIDECVRYMNELGSTHYRKETSSTRRLITKLLNDNFTIDDIKDVIFDRFKEWVEYRPAKGQKDMAMYYRPETLFGSKFESYLENYKRLSKE